MRVASTVSPVLKEMPLPADWVLEGTPVPMGQILLRSPDKKQFTGFWECPAGRFRFDFAYHETIRILGGSAVIEDETGAVHTLTAGDLAHFPLGSKTIWRVETYVKKLFFILTPEPLDL